MQFWRNNYLLSLKDRTHPKLKETRVRSSFSTRMSDVVRIKDDVPTGNWRIGRIQDLTQSEDSNLFAHQIF